MYQVLKMALTMGTQNVFSKLNHNIFYKVALIIFNVTKEKTEAHWTWIIAPLSTVEVAEAGLEPFFSWFRGLYSSYVVLSLRSPSAHWRGEHAVWRNTGVPVKSVLGVFSSYVEQLGEDPWDPGLLYYGILHKTFCLLFWSLVCSFN